MLTRLYLKSLLLIIATVLFLGLLGSQIALYSFIHQEAETKEHIANHISDLESNIGYRGLIHNFKNAVLRKDRPDYVEAALENANNVVATISQIEREAEKIGVDLSAHNLNSVLATVITYRLHLDTVVKGHARGLSISEIDRLVKVDDGPAVTQLKAFRAAVFDAMEMRKAWIVTIIAGIILALALFVTVFVFVTLRRYEAVLSKNRERLERAERLAKEESRTKTKLLKSVSHEMLSPLHVISGFAEILHSDAKSAPTVASDLVATYTQNILLSSASLRNSMENLVQYASVETLKDEASFQSLPVARIVHASTRHYSEALLKKRIHLDVALEDDLNVVGREQWLTTVFRQLFDNAVKFSKPGGTIKVIARSLSQDDVQICIRDSGPGFPPGMAERAFTPFDKLGRETSDTLGVGIGLTLTRSLVEAMGGSVRVEQSGLDEGARVCISLRRAKEPADA